MTIPVKNKVPTDVPGNEAPDSYAEESADSSAGQSDAQNLLVAQISQLQQQLEQAKEREQRALADYRNLARRNQEDRVKFLSMANRELLLSLITPLGHLNRAANQMQDKGISLIVSEFKNTLSQFELEEIDALGKPFDVATMEVVERRGDGETVIEILQAGYRLNGEVIAHAKVVIGE